MEVCLTVKQLIEKGLEAPISEKTVVEAIRLKAIVFYDWVNPMNIFIPKDFRPSPLPKSDVKESPKRLRRKIRV